MRKCDLDLAPEAPWRCPENCDRFELRMADVNWRHGSLITPPTPDAPDSIGSDESVAALLDEAEDIINTAGPGIKAEVDEERWEAERRFGDRRGLRRWWPFGKR